MLSDYRFRTELHCHARPVSPCSDFYPKQVIEHYAPLGYDSIVLCNHFHCGLDGYNDREGYVKQYLDSYRETKEEAEKYGITVIFGCEIRFARHDNNDYLLFGIDPEDTAKLYTYLEGDIETFSKAFRRDGHLLIQAHPFRDGMVKVDPSLLDGIETFNLHAGHNSRVAVAAKYAAEHDFIATCGTDFHHEGHQGLCAMLTKEKIVDSHQLCSVLKSRDYLMQIGASVILPYGVTEADA